MAVGAVVAVALLVFGFAAQRPQFVFRAVVVAAAQYGLFVHLAGGDDFVPVWAVLLLLAAELGHWSAARAGVPEDGAARVRRLAALGAIALAALAVAALVVSARVAPGAGLAGELVAVAAAAAVLGLLTMLARWRQPADDDTGRRSASAVRVVLVALALAVLLAVVAYGAGGGGSTEGQVAWRSAGWPVALVTVSLMSLVVAAAAAAAAVAAYWALGALGAVRFRHFVDGARFSKWQLLTLVAIAAAVASLPMEVGRTLGPAVGLSPPDRREGEAAGTAETIWVLFLLAALLALLALIAYSQLVRRRRRSERRSETAAALAVAVDEGLDELRGEHDARRAVIAAYARMERTLKGRGLPRSPAEAPLEYLARVLAQLNVPPAAIARLTDLFEYAKFSGHAVSPHMRDEAIAALEALAQALAGDRDDKRAAPIGRPAEAS